MESPSATDLQRSLAKNFLFVDLSSEQVTALAQQVWVERIPAGSVIVREGDQADALYVVIEGGVNVTKTDGQFLAYLGPGGFFGEMALFLDHPRRSATCVSNEDTTCAVVRKDVLERFCNDQPDAGLAIYRTIIQTLAERLQNTSADLAYLMGAQVKRQPDVDAMVASSRREPEDPSS